MTERATITLLLREVGVPANVIGYAMLRDSLQMLLEDNSLRKALTTRLYPDIAKKYATKGFSVERNLRHAVDRAHSRLTPQMERLFGDEKPTVGRFIWTLLEELWTVSEDHKDRNQHILTHTVDSLKMD